jgi:hypothetical protein
MSSSGRLLYPASEFPPAGGSSGLVGREGSGGLSYPDSQDMQALAGGT